MKNSIRDILQKLRENGKVSEEDLLRTTSTLDTIFEYAIKKGRSINCDKFSKTISLDIILENKRYELLKYVDIKTLLKPNRKNINESYLETILKLYKRKERINLSFINPFDNAESLDETARVYLLYAKYDLVDYLPMLDSELLLLKSLENRKEGLKEKIEQFFFSKESKPSLLEIMLDKDESLTMTKILNEPLKREFDIAMILRMRNIIQKNVEFDLKPNDIVKKMLDRINEEYESIVLSNEEEQLLKTLYDLFIDTSDEEALDTLINSYRVELSKKNKNTINEIRTLIDLKLSDKPAYIKIGQSSYSLSTNGVCIDKPSIDTLNHEMGHALFHNLTDGSIPEEFWQIIERIRQDSRTIRRVKEYSIQGRSEMKKVSSWVNEKYEEVFPMMNKIIELYRIRSTLQRYYDYKLDEERIRLEKETYRVRGEISDYLRMSKKEKMKIYKAKGYREEDLEILFNDAFTVKEYAMMHRRIQKRELRDVLNSTIFAPSRSIGDILDAIYQGKFMSGNLFYMGEEIEPVTGHGLFYYNHDKKYIFDEILADFRTIMMSDESEKYLKELRYYVGNELVDFLNNYYNNIMINGYMKGDIYGR